MDKKLIGLFTLFFLVFTFFSIIVLGRDPLKRLTRATEDKSPSPVSSVLLAWPLSTRVNTQSTVTAFVRSLSGKPIANKVVSFTTTKGAVRPATAISDEAGKAEVILYCSEPGVSQISATVDSTVAINQTISVECIQQ